MCELTIRSSRFLLRKFLRHLVMFITPDNSGKPEKRTLQTHWVGTGCRNTCSRFFSRENTQTFKPQSYVQVNLELKHSDLCTAPGHKMCVGGKSQGSLTGHRVSCLAQKRTQNLRAMQTLRDQESKILSHNVAQSQSQRHRQEPQELPIQK